MSLLIQFVRGCNLWAFGGCSYCFYRDAIPEETAFMEVEIFEDILTQYIQVFTNHKVIRIFLHGGEALLVGKDYFQTVLEVEKKIETSFAVKMENYLQTNATMMTEEWAEFLKANNIKTGVSMEALPELQNQFRCGTADAVLGGIKKLQWAGIYPSVISVINKSSLANLLIDDHIERHFGFFIRNGITSWAYNPYISHNLADPERITSDEYKLFLESVINHWLKLPPEPVVKIREIDDLLRITTGEEAQGCTFSLGCAHQLAVDTSGNIFPCERLIGSKFWTNMGNIKNKGLRDVIKSGPYQDFLKTTQELPKQCLNCELKNSCNNGCTAMRDTHGKFIFCETIKELSNYLKEVIKDACSTQSGPRAY